MNLEDFWNYCRIEGDSEKGLILDSEGNSFTKDGTDLIGEYYKEDDAIVFAINHKYYWELGDLEMEELIREKLNDIIKSSNDTPIKLVQVGKKI